MALKDFNQTLYFLEKKKVSDGLGGWTTEYVKGAEFEGVIERQGVSEQSLATQKGLNEVWILIVNKGIDLNPNDYVQFGTKTFRVVTDELVSPSKSSIQVHQYQLEYVTL